MKNKGLLIPVILVICWWLVSAMQLVNSYLIPSPLQIIKTTVLLINKNILYKHITASLCRVFAGFSLSFAAAFPLAVLFGMNRRFLPYFDLLLNYIRHISPIACIPLLILWFGIGEASKLAVIVLASFFPIFLNSLEGIIGCDKKLIEVAQIFALSRKDKFLHILLPAALPSVVLGMRLGLGYSWRALIGAELIAASAGIGYMIIEAEQISRPDIVIIGILIIGFIGWVIDNIFIKLSRWMMPWNKENIHGRTENL